MRVLVSYHDGSQKIELDDGKVVLLSSPYPDGSRKIFGDKGKTGWLSREYSDGSREAMLNFDTYHVVERNFQFFGKQEVWEKLKGGGLQSLSSDEKQQAREAFTQAGQGEVFVLLEKDVESQKWRQGREDSRRRYGEQVAQQDRERYENFQALAIFLKQHLSYESDFPFLAYELGMDETVLRDFANYLEAQGLLWWSDEEEFVTDEEHYSEQADEEEYEDLSNEEAWLKDKQEAEQTQIRWSLFEERYGSKLDGEEEESEKLTTLFSLRKEAIEIWTRDNKDTFYKQKLAEILDQINNTPSDQRTGKKWEWLQKISDYLRKLVADTTQPEP